MKNDFTGEYMQKYAKGVWNRMVRAWFYTIKGADVVGQLRYVGYTILGIYAVLKLDNYLWLVAMTLVAIPLLLAAGWIYVHRMAKNLDLTNIILGNYFGSMNIDLAKENVQLLQDILVELKKKSTATEKSPEV